MNKDETWALFKLGKDAWNDWAEDMHSKRKALEKAGNWAVDSWGDVQNDATKNWLEEAKADFSDRAFTPEDFPNGVDFSGFIFPAAARFSRVSFGGDAWFTAAKFGGDAWFGEASFGGPAWFTAAKFGGDAWFGEASFGGPAEFMEASFGQDAWFTAAEFGGDVWFGGASFVGTAWFGQASFGGDVGFTAVKFGGDVWFGEASFGGTAWFGEASFGGDAGFTAVKFGGDALFFQASFESYTSFERAQFDGPSNFGAIEIKSSLTLKDATFKQVPDFIQANFAQAPRLDDLSIEPQSLQRLLWLVGDHLWKRRELGNQRLVLAAAWRVIRRSTQNLRPFSREIEREAKWRSVKKLANEAHDHSREQEFFAEELKTRRNVSGVREAIIWFASILYQGLSNFGRSLLLPFIWLAVTVVAFEDIYLDSHRSYVTDEKVAVQACVVGSEHSDAESAAFALSLRNTLSFAGLGGPEKLNQVYRCLYGVEGTTSAAFPESRMPPHIPDNVAIWSFIQTVFSAALIFLLLLALRNHFRIK